MKFFHGDCLEKMRELGDGTIDSIVTDPPYGLSFMGKGWDYGVPGSEFWVEALRVAKPGTHLLAFGGTRTYRRLAVAIEDAGWEIRDCVMWVYGSGFPKSHNVSKGIDKASDFNGEVIGTEKIDIGIQGGSMHTGRKTNVVERKIRKPSPNASKWGGWGTALKPAYEPIIVARKPLTSTVAENVLRHGTGAINVDGCRVGSDSEYHSGYHSEETKVQGQVYGWANSDKFLRCKPSAQGRWPANLIHDGGEEVVAGFPSAARFFYCAKASKADRDEGCEGLDNKEWRNEGAAIPERKNRPFLPSKNNHPTVKPTALMRYLCRLVTPLSGIVLDPFMGSGSTGKAAMLEGFDFVGIEKEADYIKIAEARIAKAKAEKQEQLL